LIFVDQSTEDGSAADPLVVEVSNGRLGSGRVKVQGPVGPCPVVVGDVLGEHEAQVSYTPMMSVRSVTSRRTVPTQRSAHALDDAVNYTG
jgi:hypothetical protein